jgi:hypothetical protein
MVRVWWLLLLLLLVHGAVFFACAVCYSCVQGITSENVAERSVFHPNSHRMPALMSVWVWLLVWVWVWV